MTNLAQVILTPTELQQHNSCRGIVDVVKPKIGSLLYRYVNVTEPTQRRTRGRAVQNKRPTKLTDETCYVVIRLMRKQRGVNKGITDIAICSEVISIKRNQIFYDITGFSFNIKLNNQAHWFNREDLSRYTYNWDVPIEPEVQPAPVIIGQSFIADFIIHSPPMIIERVPPHAGDEVIISPTSGIQSWEQPTRFISPPRSDESI